MSDPIEETKQNPEEESPPEEIQAAAAQEEEKPKKKSPWLRVVLFGWLILIVVALLSGYTGFQSGTNDRQATQVAQDTSQIDNQFQLGLEDLISKECDRSRQRFEWVLERRPDYPGAIDALAESITCMNATATPTPVTPTPTPTVTPTPDTRSIEEKFTQAKEAMAALDWDATISTLFALRKENLDYQAVEVDSMLYVAYRNRGVNRILRLGELEGGLFDLTQAELFGPLDSEATSYRSLARLYLIGVSFYSVKDWAQASFYLGQVAPFAPNLYNGSSGFAIEWYLESLEKYIEQLEDAKEWCTAESQLEILVEYAPNFDREQLLEKFKKRCNDS